MEGQLGAATIQTDCGGDKYPIGRFILHRARALGMSRNDLVHRLGYRDDDSGHEGPCCTDRVKPEAELKSYRCSCDANRLRTSEIKHVVQDANGDAHLGRSTDIGPRAQRVADHPFVAADRSLRQCPTIVARGLLPSHAPTFGDDPEMLITLRWDSPNGGTRYRPRTRRHDHRSIRETLATP